MQPSCLNPYDIYVRPLSEANATLFFQDQKCVEMALRVVLGLPKLSVQSVFSVEQLCSIFHRDSRLGALAVDAKGKIYQLRFLLDEKSLCQGMHEIFVDYGLVLAHFNPVSDSNPKKAQPAVKTIIFSNGNLRRVWDGAASLFKNWSVAFVDIGAFKQDRLADYLSRDLFSHEPGFKIPLFEQRFIELWPSQEKKEESPDMETQPEPLEDTPREAEDVSETSAYKAGYEKGFSDGVAEGRKQGKSGYPGGRGKGKKHYLAKCFAAKLPARTVADIFDLSLDEVKQKRKAFRHLI